MPQGSRGTTSSHQPSCQYATTQRRSFCCHISQTLTHSVLKQGPCTVSDHWLNLLDPSGVNLLVPSALVESEGPPAEDPPNPILLAIRLIRDGRVLQKAGYSPELYFISLCGISATSDNFVLLYFSVLLASWCF